ncbi:MAG: hypothetical protein U9R74_19900, partial [Pseudomonadota bacterium]|nr:hypothetical protein [Pseudomonadota bacterium]
MKQTRQRPPRANAGWPLAFLVILSAMVLAGPGPAAERRENPKTGLWIWQHAQSGFSFELAQLHGDYVSAVFGSKGFTPAMLKTLSEYCFFGTIVRNSSQGPVTMRVADWFARTPHGHDQTL